MKGSGIEWGDKPCPLHVMDEPGEFWVGRVVKRTNGEIDLGHITGFIRNSTQELIVKIAWSSGKETATHPANIELL